MPVSKLTQLTNFVSIRKYNEQVMHMTPIAVEIISQISKTFELSWEHTSVDGEI